MTINTGNERETPSSFVHEKSKETEINSLCSNCGEQLLSAEEFQGHFSSNL